VTSLHHMYTGSDFVPTHGSRDTAHAQSRFGLFTWGNRW